MIFCTLLVILFLQNESKICLCSRFDRNNVGVTFQPYVKQLNGAENELLYKFEDTVAMMTVASGKFSKILVQDSLGFQNLYLPSYTSHHGYNASLHCGEAAARINQAGSSSRSLNLLFGLYGTETDNAQAEMEIKLAFEAAEKANKMFPGTVVGISLGHTGDLQRMQRILGHLQSFRKRAIELDLKLGVQQNCYTHLIDTDSNIETLQREIVTESDFIICWTMPVKAELGPNRSFILTASYLLTFREIIYEINPNVEVIGSTYWSSSGLEKWETVDNLRIYWEGFSLWATDKNYTVYFWEAFDNPWRQEPVSDAHWGWWKLMDNSRVNSIEGFKEKVAEESGSEDDIIFTWWSGSFYIVLAVAACIAGLITVLITFVFRCFRSGKRTVLTSSQIRDFIFGTSTLSTNTPEGNCASSALKNPYDNSLEIPRDKLKIDNNHVLGMGEFGCVFKATIELEQGENFKVAVKIAKSNCSPVTLNGLLSEIKVMAFLGKHPNIVELKGAYTAEIHQGVVYVATELCSLGSLEGYLRKNQSMETCVTVSNMTAADVQEMELLTKPKIPFEELVRWSQEIACGMEHLQRKHVVHADLASRNVLLTAGKTAKISDFGLSRRMYNYTNYMKKQRQPLPWRWMSIESLKKLEFSSKSDVWSYGITLWEIFSIGDVPYAGLTWNERFVTRLINGFRPECPSYASPSVYNIMRDCWSLDPKERPDFSELVAYTGELLQKCCRKISADKGSDYLELEEIV